MRYPSKYITGPKFGGRTIIVNENMSPALVDDLRAEGFSAERFPNATPDLVIGADARANDKIILTADVYSADFAGTNRLKGRNHIPNAETVRRIQNAVYACENNPTEWREGTILALGKYQ